MPDSSENAGNAVPNSPNKTVLLSFKATGRPIPLDDVVSEFRLMRDCLKNPLSAEIATRICNKSGSHLIKLVSSRVDGDHAILRFNAPNTNSKSSVIPSVNAPDIPFCKVIFRPLEVIGHPSTSVVDHILNPEGYSSDVLDAFSAVFGEDVLDAMQKSLLNDAKIPQKLGAGEFPIIFVPRPGGGDLQITPVSPASTFMGMKRVADLYPPDGPRQPRGRWTKQAISSKPQNISGAIEGPRMRFLATMPPAMQQFEAELFRYIHGGSFPRWRDEEVSIWVLRYADMLEADIKFNSEDTRAALDRTADRMIRDASEFINDTYADAIHSASHHGISQDGIPEAASTPQVLIRRRWSKDLHYDQAQKALTSPHFEDRLRKSRISGKASS